MKKARVRFIIFHVCPSLIVALPHRRPDVYFRQDISMNASIVDLRYHMKDVLRAIDRGETVTILYRGKEKAKLMPVKSVPHETPKVQDHRLFGIWKDRDDMADPAAYVRALRQPRVVGWRKAK